MQALLMEMHGKQWELKKRNTLLEAAVAQSKGRRGWAKLTDAALAHAVKADTVWAYGRKYSMMHCLWINTEIFLLRSNPKINLYSKEHWVSALSIEDGVKTELFAFIPESDWKLMTYEGFGGDICYILIITHFFSPPDMTPVIVQQGRQRCVLWNGFRHQGVCCCHFWSSSGLVCKRLYSGETNWVLGSSCEPTWHIHKVCPIFVSERQEWRHIILPQDCCSHEYEFNSTLISITCH